MLQYWELGGYYEKKLSVKYFLFKGEVTEKDLVY